MEFQRESFRGRSHRSCRNYRLHRNTMSAIAVYQRGSNPVTHSASVCIARVMRSSDCEEKFRRIERNQFASG